MNVQLSAQQGGKAIIAGQVIDAETGELLEDVNVFLSFTTIGTSTLKNGSFKMINIPSGIFDLMVSHVGYEQHVETTQINESDSLYYEIKLEPKILQTGEIEVVAESPIEWKKNLNRFVKAFIGKTENASECKILNPEVLDLIFNEDTDTLVASSDSVLIVENAALGYRIYIILDRFIWNIDQDCGHYVIYPRFEEIQSQMSEEMSKWSENRQICYKGSLKHFLRSIQSGIGDEENFKIYAGTLIKLKTGQGHYVDPQELLLMSGIDMPVRKLIFPDYLRIEYGGKFQYNGSIINLREEYALIDTIGNLLNPLSLEISGFWAQKRIAELLPLY